MKTQKVNYFNKDIFIGQTLSEIKDVFNNELDHPDNDANPRFEYYSIKETIILDSIEVKSRVFLTFKRNRLVSFLVTFKSNDMLKLDSILRFLYQDELLNMRIDKIKKSIIIYSYISEHNLNVLGVLNSDQGPRPNTYFYLVENLEYKIN